MSFFHSIKFRFTIWYLLVLVLLLCILGASVYYFLSRSLYQNLDHDIQARALELQNIQDLNAIQMGEYRNKVGEIVFLCHYSGNTLVAMTTADEDLPVEYGFIDQALAGKKSSDTVSTKGGDKMRFIAVPITRVGPTGMMSSTQTAIVVGRSTTDIEHALDRFLFIFAISGSAMLVLAAWGGVFLARRALKPVDEISQTARNIEEGDLNQRIQVSTKDELGRLASTLNQMIERLQKSLKRQQQLTSDASHELRAPLAVIQAESSLTLQKERGTEEYKQALETVTQEAGHMSALIDRLLTLARADAGQEQLVFEKINLGNLVREVSNDIDSLCRQKGLTLEKGATSDFIVNGDKSMLRQLFLNLLNNAITYTPEGGTITVSFNVEKERATVAITDTGIGIAKDDLPHIFERFFRVDKARSRAGGNSGLGLSICEHIAEVHGGKIEVKSQPGKGSTFTVLLPGHKQ